MYYVKIQYNDGPWRTSPVRFLTRELAEKHAEKLADQFPDISNYSVEEVNPINSLKESLKGFSADLTRELS